MTLKGLNYATRRRNSTIQIQESAPKDADKFDLYLQCDQLEDAGIPENGVPDHAAVQYSEDFAGSASESIDELAGQGAHVGS